MEGQKCRNNYLAIRDTLGEALCLSRVWVEYLLAANNHVEVCYFNAIKFLVLKWNSDSSGDIVKKCVYSI